MHLYLIFKRNIFCENELVWKAGQKYEVTYQDDKAFYFGDPIRYGVAKAEIDTNFELGYED